MMKNRDGHTKGNKMIASNTKIGTGSDLSQQSNLDTDPKLGCQPLTFSLVRILE